MEKEDLVIRKAIIGDLQMEKCSEMQPIYDLELSLETVGFLTHSIYKIMTSDESKLAYFKENSCIEKMLSNYLKDITTENFFLLGSLVRERLFGFVKRHMNIPKGNISIVEFQYDSELYLAILKLNYKEIFLFVEEGEHMAKITTKSNLALPSKKMKLTEAAVIRLTDMQLQLLEKQFMVDGVRTNYFSSMFLECSPIISEHVKFKLFMKVLNDVNKKYYSMNYEKNMKIKHVLYEALLESGSLNIDKICEKLYGSEYEVYEEVREKLAKHHILAYQIEPKEEKTVKDINFHKLITDTGINLEVPSNSQEIVFSEEEDGTYSIILNNIGSITFR